MSETGSVEGRARATKMGAVTFTICAAGLAGLTGWLLWQLLSVGGYTREPVQPIVVAVREIEAGHPFRPGDLKVVPWPASSVPPGSYSSVDPLLSPEARVPAGGIVRGEPIVKDRLAPSGNGLSALVSSRSRAVAIKVEREMLAARLLYPGSRVDVIATLNEVGGTVARTILQDIRVLAVGTIADVETARRYADREKRENAGGLSNIIENQAVVTLEVSPADAERLSLAAREGKIDLALRNASDRSISSTEGANTRALIGSSEKNVTAQDPGTGELPPASTAKSRHSSSRAPSLTFSARDRGTDDKGGRSSGSSGIEVYRVPNSNP